MADLRLLIEVLTKGQGDLKKLNGDLKKTGDEAEKTGTKLGGMGKAIGAFATGFVAFKAVEFLSEATNAAAEFNDTVSASGVIFDQEAVPALEEWADQAASSFGASKQQALDAANTFAVFGKSAGLAGADLTDFSTDLSELAGDLASFRGGTTEDAITAIGAALRGESEPIRRYGVLLDDATLRQKALELGIVDTVNNALTPQQRVLAAQAEIFEQTSDAQGDFARTSDDMANVQRTLAAELENINIEIGQKLIPVLVEFARWIRDDGIPLLNELVDHLDEAAEAVGNVADVFTILPGDMFGDFPDDARTVVGILQDMGVEAEEAAPLFEVFGDDVGDVRAEVERWKDSGKTFEQGMATLGNALEDEGKHVRDFRLDLDPMAEDAALQAEGAADGMATEIGEAPQKMADELLANQFHMGDAIEELIQFIKDSFQPATLVGESVGFLLSQELANALDDNDPLVRQKAQELADEALAQLRTNLPMAMDAGAELAASYASGIVNNLGVVSDAGRKLGGALQSQIRIESEPPDHSSPLFGITKWGANLVQTYADGITSSLSVAESAARGLAASVVPGTSTALTTAPGAIDGLGTESSAVGGYHTHIHLTYSGEMPDEPEDLVELLKQVAPFIDGRLRLAD